MKCEACEHENVEGARFCANCGAVLAGESEEAGLVGQVIGGRFRITRVLGEGGMGVVYEAEQPMGSTVRKVAVKTLHSHLSHDPSVAARFHRECGTVAQLEHPNTIKVYDFGATPDGTLYIAMEFVRGKALSDLIQEQGALPPERVLKIVRQIAGSLSEAHRQGIIHRDLKPENVVLTERAGEKDVVKLLDFGIAARTESADAEKEQKLTQQGMVLGTPPYMSPEQFTGKALDARSDIYSLGVMAYEMATGRLPFEATTPWQWATEHMMSQPIPFEATPASSKIPESMRHAIMRALSKDRDQRQTTVDEFYTELSTEGRASAASGASGTARMEAAPDFASHGGLATAKTANMPAGMAGSSPGPIAAAPPPPPAARGGGKGLIVGLGAVGAVLLVGIVVVAAQSMKPKEEEQLTNPFTGSASTGATIAPVLDPTETPTGEPPPDETEGTGGAEEEDEEPAKPSKPPTKSTSSPTPAKTTPPATQPPPQNTTPPPSSAQACSACLNAARSGNVTSAAANYRSCNDPGAKAQCSAAARNQAPGAARTAAFNGNCSQAKAIVAAASAMGASSVALSNAVKTCP